MSLDAVTYLNRESPEVAEVAPFFSKLKQAIAESKQARAPAPQWLSMIKALTQKGIKQIEMEERVSEIARETPFVSPTRVGGQPRNTVAIPRTELTPERAARMMGQLRIGL